MFLGNIFQMQVIDQHEYKEYAKMEKIIGAIFEKSKKSKNTLSEAVQPAKF